MNANNEECTLKRLTLKLMALRTSKNVNIIGIN